MYSASGYRDACLPYLQSVENDKIATGKIHIFERIQPVVRDFPHFSSSMDKRGCSVVWYTCLAWICVWGRFHTWSRWAVMTIRFPVSCDKAYSNMCGLVPLNCANASRDWANNNESNSIRGKALVCCVCLFPHPITHARLYYMMKRETRAITTHNKQ